MVENRKLLLLYIVDASKVRDGLEFKRIPKPENDFMNPLRFDLYIGIGRGFG